MGLASVIKSSSLSRKNLARPLISGIGLPSSSAPSKNSRNAEIARCRGVDNLASCDCKTSISTLLLISTSEADIARCIAYSNSSVIHSARPVSQDILPLVYPKLWLVPSMSPIASMTVLRSNRYSSELVRRFHLNQSGELEDAECSVQLSGRTCGIHKYRRRDREQSNWREQDIHHECDQALHHLLNMRPTYLRSAKEYVVLKWSSSLGKWSVTPAADERLCLPYGLYTVAWQVVRTVRSCTPHQCRALCLTRYNSTNIDLI
jgi:hypothetical protein